MVNGVTSLAEAAQLIRAAGVFAADARDYAAVEAMVSAAMVRMLCGPDARYITGQTIHINGGALRP